MMQLAAIKKILRSGPYAWPGGYEIIFCGNQGDVMCFECVKKNWREVVQDTKAALASPGYTTEWTLEGVDVNYEDPGLYCAECNRRLRPEYGED